MQRSGAIDRKVPDYRRPSIWLYLVQTLKPVTATRYREMVWQLTPQNIFEEVKQESLSPLEIRPELTAVRSAYVISLISLFPPE